MRYLLLFSLSLSIASCSTTKKTNEIIDETKTNTYRFGVSFYSIGTGIDVDSKQNFMRFIKTFEETNKVNLSYETVQWGREGEVDYCFTLNELSKTNQKRFISETKKEMTNAAHVRFKENEACRVR